MNFLITGGTPPGILSISLTIKPIGGLLLLLGLAVIAYGLYSSWQIFTGRDLPPEIFKASSVKQEGSSKVFEIDLQLDKLLGTQLQQVLPADALPRLLNLLSWSIFASLLVFGGTQVSGLGIKLLKG
jgi:hypothetical protein